MKLAGIVTAIAFMFWVIFKKSWCLSNIESSTYVWYLFVCEYCESMCVCMYTYVYRGFQRPEASNPLRTGVTSGCEPYNPGAGNLTQVYFKYTKPS